jgi:hypothetical protein
VIEPPFATVRLKNHEPADDVQIVLDNGAASMAATSTASTALNYCPKVRADTKFLVYQDRPRDLLTQAKSNRGRPPDHDRSIHII